MQLLFWLYIVFKPCMEFFTVEKMGSDDQELGIKKKVGGGKKGKPFCHSL